MVIILTIAHCRLPSFMPPKFLLLARRDHQTSLVQYKHVAFNNKGAACTGTNFRIRVREYRTASWNASGRTYDCENRSKICTALHGCNANSEQAHKLHVSAHTSHAAHQILTYKYSIIQPYNINVITSPNNETFRFVSSAGYRKTVYFL